MNEEVMKKGIFYRRVIRCYDTVIMENKRVPTIYIIKPDQIRFWTRSMALRDADEVAADILNWQESSDSSLHLKDRLHG